MLTESEIRARMEAAVAAALEQEQARLARATAKEERRAAARAEHDAWLEQRRRERAEEREENRRVADEERTARLSSDDKFDLMVTERTGMTPEQLAAHRAAVNDPARQAEAEERNRLAEEARKAELAAQDAQDKLPCPECGHPRGKHNLGCFADVTCPCMWDPSDG
jgi:hypothetical protein